MALPLPRFKFPGPNGRGMNAWTLCPLALQGFWVASASQLPGAPGPQNS